MLVYSFSFVKFLSTKQLDLLTDFVCVVFCRNSKDIQLSKSLSWLLRHGAVKEGFDLSSEGYIDINKILQHKSFKSYNLNDIERVVRNNDKQRFLLRHNPVSNLTEIKAHQGHTIDTVSDAELTPILTAKYKTVVHGTYIKCWPDIKQTGLSRMRRRHIHLAKSTNSDTVISGIRTNAQIHIFINLPKALEDGIKFYESDNGVILTPGNDKGFLEAKYFDRVVEVPTGYPPYTKPQDLAHAFCQFGSVRLNHDWITDTAACLEFTEPAHAAAAIRASRSVNVYGAFLTVRPCTLASRPRAQPRRREPRLQLGNNFKGKIIEPINIPLQGAFHQQLDALLCAVRLTQPEIERLATLYRDLEYVLSEIWPGCRAIPFGSVTTGLGVKSSDADCFVSLPNGSAKNSAVGRAKRALQNHPQVFDELLAIPRANTPIVKFLHIPTGVYCDLSFKTALGSQNSKLISFLLFSDPRLIPIAVAIKYWARVHDLTGTGKLTNYALTMLIIFYFQQPAISILPPVEWLQRDRSYDYYVDYWNTGFMSDLRRIPRTTNTASIAELLGGFFEFYATFDFDKLCVCPFLGRTVKKEDFKDLRLLPEEFSRYKTNVFSGATMPIRFMTTMCVQDPFEQCHNVASAVSSRLAADICAYFKFAAAAYEKEKQKHFMGFLKTILLEKPELPRVKKGGSEFRARLPPGLIANIASDDWKSVVRDVAFQVFETMLRVKLKKMEENAKVEGESEEDQEQSVVKVEETAKLRKCSISEDISGSSKQGNKANSHETPVVGKKPENIIKSGNIAKTDNKVDAAEAENSKARNRTKSEQSKPIKESVHTGDSAERDKVSAESEEVPKSEAKERTTLEKGKRLPEKGKGQLNKRGKVIKEGGIAKKEKEIYMGEITKAIWKRKLFSKLYSVMGLKFLDRETMITDEIMKVDKNVIDVKFQVIVTFNNAPRSAVVSIRHGAGELNCFKEFGKFFNKIFQHWFVVLYKPYCRNFTKNQGDQKPTAVTDEEAAAKELNEVMKEDLQDKSDSDSDSDLSYEDERINPNLEVNSEIKDNVKHDIDKNIKNKSNNAVKKQNESEKKCDTNANSDNKSPLKDKKHDKDELPSEKSPRKSKKSQQDDKKTVVDHINSGVESLLLSDKSPQKIKAGDHSRNQETGKSKTRHRNRKSKDPQAVETESAKSKSAVENGQIS